MADRPVQVSALALSGLIMTLVLGTALALFAQAKGLSLRPADWSAIRFTVLQALLSTGFSCLLAIPVARALIRRRFPGRAALIVLMGAPFLLPVIVAVLGLLSLYGRNGVLNLALQAVGLPAVSVYGLKGVVLAHVFFNLPLATRMLLNGWQAIPAERFRLAQTLGLPSPFRHVEWPMLRAVLPGAALAIFLVCLTSFVVALTLGGGPRATTLELAIYQALRFDFDPGRAALLAAVQFALCILAVALAARVTLPMGLGAGQDRALAVPAPRGWRRLADALVIGLAALFLMLPLAFILIDGLPGLARLGPTVWQAALRSVWMAAISASLAVSAALMLTLAAATGARRLIEVAAMLPMATSGLVLGTGLFLLLRGFARPEALALPVTIGVNALMALPFLFRLLLPEVRILQADYDRLAQAVGLKGWARLRWLTLPRLARPLGLGAGLAAALAMGDLGVIALFAGDGQATLPLMVQRLAGAYRMEEASAAALLLVGLSFALFALCDLGGRRAAP
ncbi:ABC transporter permease subunit [bacterium]|nr:ABC transporter permease subunit [bacterium]